MSEYDDDETVGLSEEDLRGPSDENATDEPEEVEMEDVSPPDDEEDAD
jgi:hypothetical protein